MGSWNSSSSMMEAMTVAIEGSSRDGFLNPRLAFRLPWLSQSRSRTFFPCLASPIPRFTVVVDLPTPPFIFTIEMILHMISPFLYSYILCRS